MHATFSDVGPREKVSEHDMKDDAIVVSSKRAVVIKDDIVGQSMNSTNSSSLASSEEGGAEEINVLKVMVKKMSEQIVDLQSSESEMLKKVVAIEQESTGHRRSSLLNYFKKK
jgi:hypothetical protein